MSNSQPKVRARAFTLVELLVVIGIIAMLIGILLPALSRARETSKRVVCLSNLRQMTIAAGIYLTTNRGIYPVSYWETYQGTTTYDWNWDFTAVQTPGQPTTTIPGLLWDRSTNLKIQQCPSFDGASNAGADAYTGYNYNISFIGHGQWEAIPSPARATQIRNSWRVALFGDGQYISGANKFMRAPFPSAGDATFSGRWAGTQGYRHQKMTNVAYCDGHCASVSARFTSNQDGAATVAAGTGFLSADNSAYGQ